METTFGTAPMMCNADPAAAKALVGRVHMVADAILRRAASGADTTALTDLYFLLCDEQRDSEVSALDKVRAQHAEMAAWLERYSYGSSTYTAVAERVSLESLGRDRATAVEMLAERTALLRVGVLQALEAGESESGVARQAGVDRMTVRKWAGKLGGETNPGDA